MNCFIKSRDTFLTYAQAFVTEYDTPLMTAEGVTGTVTVAGELTQDYTGEWLVLGEYLLYIVSVAPANNFTELVVGDPFTAFSRVVAYTEPTSYYLGEYIKAFAESEYINQGDPYFDMPYLTVTNSDTTEFAHVAPNDGLTSLEMVIRDAMAKGVLITVSFNEDSLTLAISTGSTTRQTVVLGDGRSELREETYNRQLISKVTVISELGYPHYYYKTLTGEITTTAPVNRPRGEWVTVQQGADNLLDTAKEAFAASIDSHKIAFYSTLELPMGQPLLVRLKGKVYETQVTYIGIQSYDSRFLYECGEAVSTLTGRVAELGRAVAGAVASIPSAFSQIKNDIGAMRYLGANPITAPANDTRDNWSALGSGYAYYSQAGALNGQPAQYGILVNYVSGTNVTQWFLPFGAYSPHMRASTSGGWYGNGWRKLAEASDVLPTQSSSETITYSAISAVGFGMATSATAVRLFIPMPNNAAGASINTTGTWAVATDGGVVSVSGLAVAQVERSGLWVYGTASGLTSGAPVTLRCTTGSSLTISWT